MLFREFYFDPDSGGKNGTFRTKVPGSRVFGLNTN